MPAKSARQHSCRVEWARPALQSYRDTLQHIAEQDAETLALFEQRVMHAVSLIAEQPGIGTPRTRHGKRAFAVPKTGHTIEYQAQDGPCSSCAGTASAASGPDQAPVATGRAGLACHSPHEPGYSATLRVTVPQVLLIAAGVAIVLFLTAHRH